MIRLPFGLGSIKTAGSRRRNRSVTASRMRFRDAEPLESRRLLAVAPVAIDDENGAAGGCPLCGSTGCAEHMGDDGNVLVKCLYQPTTAFQTPVSIPMAPAAPLADTFKLHSLPSATKKIYLDFDGHVTSGTPWQNGASFDTPAFSLDAVRTSFSDAERQAIQEVWARVSEDFFPFEVDVTTEAPSVDDLRKAGTGDDRWGMRVVIGGNGSWMSGAAGVAYLNSFSWDSDTPCFVFADQSWKTNLNFMASCVSHEVGHTLGLRHDGHNGREYYGGRGNGETGWGPLMGNPGYVALTQWSKGEYGGSTNREDDLSIITTRNGFGYRPDDHGGTMTTATAAPSADFELSGAIGVSGDIDMFRFTASGQVQATISPISVGTNLDVLASLLNASGTVVATSNPIDKVGASFTTTVSAGTYYLAVRGTGMGDTNTTGYTAYGSLGQYTVKVGAPSGPTPSFSVANVRVVEGNVGTTSVEVSVSLSAAVQQTVTVAYATADGTAMVADADFTAATGTVTFAAGETKKTVSVQVRGDTKAEPDETFTFRLSAPNGAVIGRAEGIITITNDDAAPPPPTVPALSIQDVSIMEGQSGTSVASFTVTMSSATAGLVTVQFATRDGTASTQDADYVATSGRLTFAPGETTKTISVTVRGDTRIEADETFKVILTSPGNATIQRGEATGTIGNDDSSVPPAGSTLSVADLTVAEGDSGVVFAEFTISLSAAATRLVTVRYATADRMATGFDRDYAPALGSVVFAPGDTSKTVRVPIIGDTRREADETFALVLSAPAGAPISRGMAICTITNDDTSSGLTLSVADARVVEGNSGNKLFSFVVSLSSPATDPVSVKFRTVQGTATAGADYAAATGEVRFARGGVRQMVNIWVRGDREIEEDETFMLELFDVVGASLGRSAATGTIANDDVPVVRAALQAAAWADLGAPKPAAGTSARRLTAR